MLKTSLRACDKLPDHHIRIALRRAHFGRKLRGFFQLPRSSRPRVVFGRVRCIGWRTSTTQCPMWANSGPTLTRCWPKHGGSAIKLGRSRSKIRPNRPALVEFARRMTNTRPILALRCLALEEVWGSDATRIQRLASRRALCQLPSGADAGPRLPPHLWCRFPAQFCGMWAECPPKPILCSSKFGGAGPKPSRNQTRFRSIPAGVWPTPAHKFG